MTRQNFAERLRLRLLGRGVCPEVVSGRKGEVLGVASLHHPKGVRDLVYPAFLCKIIASEGSSRREVI